MLEVKSLYKTYHPKKGAITKALDGVTLTFPETGMVFILGKSGSGKSTLLNVCGGLDRADSGEIVIKGKSSNEFSGSDFDSYRNTYVGFIFQEYNILNELTIGENLALALELQNKKCDKRAVDELLEKVEMKDFANRKPNTLSGGQKQRIAIARALIKEPQIIMADEPTGALDSVTGKLVFDILKKLSKDKLVLIVSHDREFAEMYADRIVELKDGKVISDQVKSEDAEAPQKNVNFYGNDTVCIKNGNELTDDDFANIKQFIKKSNGSAVISTAKDTITKVKESNPTMETRGTFGEIKEQPQSKQYEQQKLIRSHLPIRHAVKMGASSLKIKPVRLGFTILLSVVAFILFGLASTLMLFNGREVKIKTMVDLKPEYIAIQKKYQEISRYGYTTEDGGEEYSEYLALRNTSFTDKEFEEFANNNKGAIRSLSLTCSIVGLNLSSTARQFYTSDIDHILAVDNSSSFELLKGRLPNALDEIIITDYTFNAFKSKNTTFKIGDKPLNIIDYDSILYSETNKVTIQLNGIAAPLKVVGIFKGMTVPKYDLKLKECADNGEYNEGRVFPSANYYINGIFSAIGVSKEFFNELKDLVQKDDVNMNKYFNSSSTMITFGVEGGEVSVRTEQMSKYKDSSLPLYSMDGKIIENATLKDNEIAIPSDSVYAFYISAYKDLDPDSPEGKKISQIILSLVAAATEKYKNENPKPANNEPDKLYQWNSKLLDVELNADPFSRNMVELGRINNKKVRDTIAECASIFKEAGYSPKMVAQKIDLKSDMSFDDNNAQGEEVKLVGYYIGGYSSCFLSDSLYEKYYTKPKYTNKVEIITKYVEPEGAYINNIFIPYDGTRLGIEKWINIKFAADDSFITIDSQVLGQIDGIATIAKVLQTTFLVSGLVLAVFSFLLIFNFISLSITAKKKDIGILRAIGARAVDVFKIFFSESLIITTICFIIAVIGSLSLCALFNNIIFEEVGVIVSLFVFGPLSVLIVLSISIFAAFISTILPVLIYTRKPPVESIRAL